MSDLDPSLLLERIRAQIGGTYYGASFTDSLLTDCANVISALSQELKAARERAESLDDRLEVALSGGAEYVQELSDQLEAARERNEQLLDDYARDMSHSSGLCIAAEAEVSRLRAALKDLQAGTPTSSTGLHALVAAALTEPEETK